MNKTETAPQPAERVIDPKWRPCQGSPFCRYPARLQLATGQWLCVEHYSEDPRRFNAKP